MSCNSRVCALALGISLGLLMLAGCRVTQPNRFETLGMDWLKHNITIGGKHEVNPLRATAANIGDGKNAFGQYCMVCHGLDGQNTGVPFAQTISPPVPSLATAEVQSYTDGQLKWIIENGIMPSGMPSAKGMFVDEDMWKLVLYIRHLPKAGSLGDPAVYGGSASK